MLLLILGGGNLFILTVVEFTTRDKRCRHCDYQNEETEKLHRANVCKLKNFKISKIRRLNMEIQGVSFADSRTTLTRLLHSTCLSTLG